MSTYFSLQSVVRRSLALTVVAGSAFAIAGAQTAPAAGAASPTQPVDLKAVAVSSTLPAQDALFSSSASYSSSADAQDAAANATQMNLASVEKTVNLPDLNAQYGRRRYGRPRYRGGNTNADGSEKYTGYVGVGAGFPTGDQFNYATTSWGIQAGVGRNFNKHFGVSIEFDYDHFGMTGATLQNQENLYNYQIAQYNASVGESDQISPISGLDGNNHIWSFSLDPTYTFHQSEALGGYVIGGAGYYHKVANFTVPTEQEYCDYYYGCYGYVANEVIDHYTSNAFGVNGGVGFTYKFSRFANERFYGEVRYVYLLNSARPGVTYATITPENAAALNDFPQNSNRTSYLPIKVGIRF